MGILLLAWIRIYIEKNESEQIRLLRSLCCTNQFVCGRWIIAAGCERAMRGSPFYRFWFCQISYLPKFAIAFFFFFSSSCYASLVAASFSIFASVSSGTDTHYYYYVWSWSCGDCAVVVVFLVHNFSHPFHCTFFNYTLFSRAHTLSPHRCRRCCCRWPPAAGAISAIAKFICTFLSRKFNLPKLQIACELQPTNTQALLSFGINLF